MLVTINTDASFHPKYNIGSYAFWIVCDAGRFQHTGVLRKQVKKPEQAEFKCIINAIHVLGKMNIKGINKIIINTDCLNVIHLINKDKHSIQKYGLGAWGKHLVAQYETLLSDLKIDKKIIEFRHVEAHKGTETKRQWVNEWCDVQAKKSLWQAINKIKKA